MNRIRAFGSASWLAARNVDRVLVAIVLAASYMGVGAQPARAGWVTLPNAPVAPASYERHDDVFFVSPDSGWVVNGAGEIHRTTDGGQSWTLQTTVPNYLRTVGFATPLKGWAGTLYGSPLLYATDDAGVTWTPVVNIPDPQPTGICGLWVVNDSVAYGCGRYDGPPSVMIKTTDGGATWTSWDMEAYATSLIDCYFVDENHGFAVGGTGSPMHRHAVILSTNDGGVTWQTRYTANRPGAEWCWKISFPTPTTGYVSIERADGLAPSYVLKTTNAGMSWTEVRFVDDYDEQGVGFATPNVGWVGGWTGYTYETIDGGASWHLAGFGLFANRFRFLSPTLGYAVGQAVYKYTGDATDVDSSPGRTQALAVSQNRPNPVTHSTRIPFSLGAETHVRGHDSRPPGKNVTHPVRRAPAGGAHGADVGHARSQWEPRRHGRLLVSHRDADPERRDEAAGDALEGRAPHSARNVTFASPSSISSPCRSRTPRTAPRATGIDRPSRAMRVPCALPSSNTRKPSPAKYSMWAWARDTVALMGSSPSRNAT